MIHVELLYLLNGGELVIHEYLKVNVAQQIKVHLVAIVSDGHNERAVFVKKADLLCERKSVKISPRNHEINI